MTIQVETLQPLLHEGLCRDIKFVHRPYDGALILQTYFAYPDGDYYRIHVTDSPTDEGGIRLSDLGHTEEELSYHCLDFNFFFEGAMGEILERVMKEAGLKWGEKGQEFCLDTTPENLPQAVFQFVQGITRIYDLTFLSRYELINRRINGGLHAQGRP